jgi:hypothetical protein
MHMDVLVPRSTWTCESGLARECGMHGATCQADATPAMYSKTSPIGHKTFFNTGVLSVRLADFDFCPFTGKPAPTGTPNSEITGGNFQHGSASNKHRFVERCAVRSNL